MEELSELIERGLRKDAESAGFDQGRWRSSVVAGSPAQKDRHHVWLGVILTLSLALLVALVPPTRAAILALLTESQEKAASVGIAETPPTGRLDEGYEPAPVPYVAVEGLSNYLGLDDPVVPETAVLSRDGRNIVFVVGDDLFYEDRYVSVQVVERSVSLGPKVGRAFVVEEGLTGCDIVIVAPPAELVTGDTVRSYAEEAADDSLRVDFEQLFPGITKADFMMTGGFLRPGSSLETIRVIVNQTGGIEIPVGSALIYKPPSGAEEKMALPGGIPEDQGFEFAVLRDRLIGGERLGSVQVVSAAGEIIASGKLDWWCP